MDRQDKGLVSRAGVVYRSKTSNGCADNARRLKKEAREHATVFIEGRERVYITFCLSGSSIPMNLKQSMCK